MLHKRPTGDEANAEVAVEKKGAVARRRCFYTRQSERAIVRRLRGQFTRTNKTTCRRAPKSPDPLIRCSIEMSLDMSATRAKAQDNNLIWVIAPTHGRTIGYRIATVGR